jgi:hypothetical protein
VKIGATLVDSEYGGKHLDVVCLVGETRLQARLPSGATSGWIPDTKPGQAVIVSFAPTDALLYDDESGRPVEASAMDASPASVRAS